MVFLSLLFVAVLLAQLWAPGNWTPELVVLDWVLYGVFVIDFGVRLCLCRTRSAFLRDFWNILDIVVIISPLLALIGGRLFGLARVGRVIRLLRVVRLQALVVRATGRSVKAVASPGNTKYILLFAALFVLIAAFGIWRYEAPVNPGIHTWFDALWWSIVTLVTVGYSDPSPLSSEGRVFALILIPAGLVVVAWLTALLASHFVEEADEEEEQQMDDRLAAIEDKLDRIERLLTGDGRHVIGRAKSGQVPEGEPGLRARE